LEIYGFTEADPIVDLKQNDPEWFDTNRPSKLPGFANEFGPNGHFYFSPRHTRFGVKAIIPTSSGEVQTTFEFDLVGVGRKAGQTAFRLRHAWGKWKQIGAGHTFSQFMDPDVEPAGLLGTERHDDHPHASGLLAAVSGRRLQRADRCGEPGSDR
jgi:hypothetical protein